MYMLDIENIYSKIVLIIDKIYILFKSKSVNYQFNFDLCTILVDENYYLV